ncbi:Asp-tRNA(Asn)/Glu-tRNA(Gln) amidotransferase subunit GatC [Candidatus Parcubacteria bacterium]|nr:Asp-tRNA(Asn)/Glu-tRNA(Gln) amidotransferase subunit GatC [Candidatus Parcubacteria bacterium]
MDSAEVLKLAKLARIEISAEEAESLSHEFDAILNYVSEVKAVATSPNPLLAKERAKGEVNIMREDANPHESGIYTERLLNQAPQRDGSYIKVKKIL